MPRQNWQRLKKRADFQKLQKQGQAIKMPALVVLYAPVTSLAAHGRNNSLGFTATKRSIGNAVKRNRTKRRMRALATHVLKRATPPHQQPVNVVMIARHYMLSRDFAKMAQELENALKKEGFTFDAPSKP